MESIKSEKRDKIVVWVCTKRYKSKNANTESDWDPIASPRAF